MGFAPSIWASVFKALTEAVNQRAIHAGAALEVTQTAFLLGLASLGMGEGLSQSRYPADGML